MHGGQPYFLASLTILPRRFFTVSSLSCEYGRSLVVYTAPKIRNPSGKTNEVAKLSLATAQTIVEVS